MRSYAFLRTKSLRHIPNHQLSLQLSPCRHPLFLLVLGLLSPETSTLLTHTLETSLAPGLAQLLVGILLAGVVCDLALGDLGLVDDRQNVADLLGSGTLLRALLGSLDLLSGSVTLPDLAVAAGEEDEAVGVLLETGDVGSERLLRQVLAAGINGDANGGSKLAGNTSSLVRHC